MWVPGVDHSTGQGIPPTHSLWRLAAHRPPGASIYLAIRIFCAGGGLDLPSCLPSGNATLGSTGRITLWAGSTLALVILHLFVRPEVKGCLQLRSVNLAPLANARWQESGPWGCPDGLSFGGDLAHHSMVGFYLKLPMINALRAGPI